MTQNRSTQVVSSSILPSSVDNFLVKKAHFWAYA